MIAAGIPCGRLTEIRRNSGEIVEACAAIRDGERITKIARTLDGPENLCFLNVPQDLDAVMKKIKEIIEYEGRDGTLDFAAVKNAQIIVAINEKSALSRKALNERLQDYFNAIPADCSESDIVSKVRKFRPLDKIICLANGIAPSTETGEELRVANGDIGFLEMIVKEGIVVDVNENHVIVPTFSDLWGEANWDLGYAISCHKSQGSEWPVVIIILDSSFAAGMICDRHWIYTAISRAKERCYLLGSESSIAAMSRISKMWERKTLLVERFCEMRWSQGKRPPAIPKGPEMERIAETVLAAAIFYANDALALLERLKTENVIHGFDNRIIEQFAVPTAIYSCAGQMNELYAHSLLADSLNEYDKENLPVQDHERLIGDIMTSVVKVNGYGDYTVGQCLERFKLGVNTDPFRDALEKVGIGPPSINPASPNFEMVFINPTTVSRFLLDNTMWKGKTVRQILIYAHGAVEAQQRLGGAVYRGIKIPTKLFDGTEKDAEITSEGDENF